MTQLGLKGSARALKICLEYLRACLKTHLGFKTAAFGVPPSGGFRALPPEGGTPNRGFQTGSKERFIM